jgi:hypothetical protein
MEAATVLPSAAAAFGSVKLPVPNHSFEAPFTVFAYPDAEVWEESGPVGENPQLPGVVDSLDTGVFFNSPVGSDGGPSPFYIPNGDQNQIGFIGADDSLDIAFFQQLDEVFEPGAAYALTVAVGESFFFPPLTFNPNDPNPPPNPDPALLAIGFYRVIGDDERATVVQRLVSTAELPGGFERGLLLAEFAIESSALPGADPAVGEPIGIEIYPFDGLSGVWNVDNVRVQIDCGLTALVGDADANDLVDLADHSLFDACLTGPSDAGRPEGCPPCAYERFDGDDDGDVDLFDHAALLLDFEP